MDVELVAAFSSAAVALAAVALSAFTTRASLRHQVNLAQRERLWHQEAPLYVDVLTWLEGAAAAMHEWSTEGHREPSFADAFKTYTPPSELGARMDVFADSRILETFDDLRKHVSAMSGALSRGDHVDAKHHRDEFGYFREMLVGQINNRTHGRDGVDLRATMLAKRQESLVE